MNEETLARVHGAQLVQFVKIAPEAARESMHGEFPLTPPYGPSSSPRKVSMEMSSTFGIELCGGDADCGNIAVREGRTRKKPRIPKIAGSSRIQVRLGANRSHCLSHRVDSRMSRMVRISTAPTLVALAGLSSKAGVSRGKILPNSHGNTITNNRSAWSRVWVRKGGMAPRTSPSTPPRSG